MRRQLLFMVLVSACKGSSHDGATPTPALTPDSGATRTPTQVSLAPPASSSAPTLVRTDAPDGAAPISATPSAKACRMLWGPIELPQHALASLVVRGDVIDAIVNDDGRPRTLFFPAGPAPGSSASARELAASVPGVMAPGNSRLGSGSTPCAAAGDRVFCADRAGAVHRTTRAGAEDRVVASTRSTARIAAATIGGAHVALAYLASRQTSEGWVSEAWLAVDDDPPTRLSEDGSGATALALAPRGLGLLALMVDARTALTALHARMVTYDGGVHLGEDAVVFVGGPGDRRTRGALVCPPSGPAWSLLPIARDVGSFGLAIVRLDDPPRVDEPVVWSMYPNGLDPAPIAAAPSGVNSTAGWVARVRPRAAEPESPRMLELGQVSPEGAFLPRDTIATTGNTTDVSLAVDQTGGLWLAWVDAAGSWLERLACR